MGEQAAQGAPRADVAETTDSPEMLEALGLFEEAAASANPRMDGDEQVQPARSAGLGRDGAAMEAAFGTSFADVELEEGEDAADAAAEVGAKAYALGNRVTLPPRVGGDRRYVLAHELAHVVQQRGGTGGRGDPEEAADAAAVAITAGLPAPAQPSAPVGIARFQGATPTTTTTTAYGTGGAVNHGTAPIGNQNADQGKGFDWGAAFDEAALSDELRDKKRELEQPRPTVMLGGAPPYFISAGDPRELSVSGSAKGDPRVQRDLRISYRPHLFHVLDALVYDIARATTAEEIDSIWSAYLEDAPQPAPWSHELEMQEVNGAAPWDIQECAADGPQNGYRAKGYWEPTSVRLPAGSPLEKGRIAVIQFEGYFISWPEPLARFADDPSGSIRVSVLVPLITAKAESIPELKRRLKKKKGAPPPHANDRDRNGRPIPTLVLPLSKEPHLGRYQSYADQRRLVHEPGYDREGVKQDRKWDAAMKHGGSYGISRAVWNDGKQLLDLLGRRYTPPHRGVYRPDWSAGNLKVDMQVDHIIELQVLGAGERDEADSISNFELLEASANRSSGSLLKNAIKDERERLYRETGDAAYREQPLYFERVVLGSAGLVGDRWTVAEIRAGDHLHWLRANSIVDAFPDAFEAGIGIL